MRGIQFVHAVTLIAELGDLNPRIAMSDSICLRNEFMRLSCVKVGNIPAHSLTQAQTLDCLSSPSTRYRERLSKRLEKTTDAETRPTTA